MGAKISVEQKDIDDKEFKWDWHLLSYNLTEYYMAHPEIKHDLNALYRILQILQ